MNKLEKAMILNLHKMIFVQNDLLETKDKLIKNYQDLVNIYIAIIKFLYEKANTKKLDKGMKICIEKAIKAKVNR